MIERKIVIGLIISTEYLKQIQGFWNPMFIEDPTARRISGWVWEYFEKYKEAPRKNIESIYFTKLKETNIPKDIAEQIEEDILPGLSEQYETEGLDVSYLLDATRKYFDEQHLRQHHDAVVALIEKGEVSEAVTLTREFRPLSGTSVSLKDFVLSVEQIRQRERKRPKLLLKPWLREGQLTIIYGNYGSGKSLVTIAVAYLLGLRDYNRDECEIGEWQVRNPTGCLYIDGELGEQEMEERVSQFEWLGRQRGDCRMRILSIPEYQMATEDSFYLSNRANQMKITEWLKEHPNYKLVVLDSASTLFGLEDENSNSEWNTKANPFFRDMRALGVACILLHHSGKDGKRGLRGASAMGAMAHNIYRLSNHEQKKTDNGEAWFVLTKDKQRASGYAFKSFGLHFYQNDEGKETYWEVTDTF